ncbi:MAG: hypothetical protein ACYDER_28445 [Ktedonobacteraceae bacterium]
MRNISLFVEDTGHREFLNALLLKIARQYKVTTTIKFESARGGHGTAITELKLFVRDLPRNNRIVPELLVAATDGNCKGYLARKQEIDDVTRQFNGTVICAIPDPHIERWFLLDSAAFKEVFGVGCSVPTYKCERHLYKKLYDEALTRAGRESILGGIEYVGMLVDAMDLDKLERTEDSLGRFLKSLRQQFQEWVRIDTQS